MIELIQLFIQEIMLKLGNINKITYPIVNDLL